MKDTSRDKQQEEEYNIELAILQRQYLQRKKFKQNLKVHLQNCKKQKKNEEQKMHKFLFKRKSLQQQLNRLDQQQQKLKINGQHLQQQLQEVKKRVSKSNSYLDLIKIGYMAINSKSTFDIDNGNIQTKCKFFPSQHPSNPYFIFNQYQNGFKMAKISSNIGYSYICSEFAFPSQGKFYFQFSVQQIRDPSVLMGVMTRSIYSNMNYPSQKLYLNFKNKCIQLNGNEIQEIECNIDNNSQLILTANMNNKTIQWNINKKYHIQINFEYLGLQKQSLYFFIALGSHQTVLYFSNL